MTNEMWQLQEGLALAGYRLLGPGFPDNIQDMRKLVPGTSGIVIIQDRREWDPSSHIAYDKSARFDNIQLLADCPNIARVTIVKDAHASPAQMAAWHQEMKIHLWIVYYHPQIVSRLASYVRPNHLIRTWHSLNPAEIPPVNYKSKHGCLLSGAVSGAYPLRRRLFREVSQLPDTAALPHPGYGLKGCRTPQYIATLSRHKVAICTASMYGYALRKIIEATAAGCRVVTDLPADDALPEIDGNLTRISIDNSTKEIADILRYEYSRYDEERQRYFAQAAIEYYDFRRLYRRLAEEIEQRVSNYTKKGA